MLRSGYMCCGIEEAQVWVGQPLKERQRMGRVKTTRTDGQKDSVWKWTQHVHRSALERRPTA